MAADARDHFVLICASALSLRAEVAKGLHPCDFVACRAVVPGDVRLDDDDGTELVRHDEIGGLIETGNFFRPFGFAIADPRVAENFLDLHFEAIPDELGHRILVPGEGAPEET